MSAEVTLNVGSLFSGIGGIDLGLERAGMRVVWQVENDDYARAVLRKHWPNAALYDDVRSVGAANLAPVDLVCGGFPCQDISNAGARAGLTGERSGLWREFERVICELRPRYVLVENVAALLARGLGTVLGALAALGYDAEWDVLPAAAFGAEHLRERLFIVANSDAVRKLQPQGRIADERRRLFDNGAAANADADTPRLPRRRSAGADGAHAAGVFARDRSFDAPPVLVSRDYWNHQPLLGRGLHGVPNRVDRIKCLGNAVVPQVAEWIGRQILAHAEGG